MPGAPLPSCVFGVWKTTRPEPPLAGGGRTEDVTALTAAMAGYNYYYFNRFHH
jgi:hypothetical protein